jgi:hypothetical protein
LAPFRGYSQFEPDVALGVAAVSNRKSTPRAADREALKIGGIAGLFDSHGQLIPSSTNPSLMMSSSSAFKLLAPGQAAGTSFGANRPKMAAKKPHAGGGSAVKIGPGVLTACDQRRKAIAETKTSAQFTPRRIPGAPIGLLAIRRRPQQVKRQRQNTTTRQVNPKMSGTPKPMPVRYKGTTSPGISFKMLSRLISPVLAGVPAPASSATAIVRAGVGSAESFNCIPLIAIDFTP